jgi:soluble lytic murein transglycosylase
LVLSVIGRPFFLLALWLCLLAGGARAELLSASDRQIYRTAFTLAKRGEYTAAERQARQAADPLLAKMVLWLAFTHGSGARFAELADFINANPDWPGQISLRQRAEEAVAGVADSTLRSWFQRFPPLTPYGRLRRAELMMSAGQNAAAIAEIRDVWINGELSAFDEKSILQRFPGVIRGEDHIRRLDRLVWDGLAEAARRIMPRVPEEYRRLADARLKLAAAKPGVEGAVAKVPAQLQNDPGLLYERLRWRRRKEQYEAATEILLNPPRDLVRPELWWTERQVLARHALADGKPQLAYRLVAKHGLKDGPAHADAEFLAGWIALRFLHDPRAGYDHFVALYNSVTKPISLARGAYWAGRAAEAMKTTPLANTWFATSAALTTTYYGQLASHQLGGDAAARLNTAEPKATPEDQAKFHKRELVRIIEALSEIGENDRIAQFQNRLSELAAAPVEHAMIATLAEQIGRLDLSVTAAKRASYAGVTLISHGYPLLDLPAGGAAERPLVLAMTRQESAFDRDAVSASGARGLMQLMPTTASQIAKARQIPFSASRLLSDAKYNLTLGRAYLDDLLERFAGSYVLSIAAYNAGPGRVNQWIDSFGDPRTKAIDVVDWIEAIPFAETRNYVQRVLENLQVYRARLGDRSLVLSLDSDLRR